MITGGISGEQFKFSYIFFKFDYAGRAMRTSYYSTTNIYC